MLTDNKIYVFKAKKIYVVVYMFLVCPHAKNKKIIKY